MLDALFLNRVPSCRGLCTCKGGWLLLPAAFKVKHLKVAQSPRICMRCFKRPSPATSRDNIHCNVVSYVSRGCVMAISSKRAIYAMKVHAQTHCMHVFLRRTCIDVCQLIFRRCFQFSTSRLHLITPLDMPAHHVI